jgi:hypothetical protein
MKASRAILFVLFGALFLITGLEQAFAQSAQCVRWSNELAALKARTHSNSNSRYGRAIDRQERELQNTERLAQRSGCYTRGRFVDQGQCRNLLQTLDKMERNLAYLRQQASGGQSNSGLIRRIGEIERAMAANRCSIARPQQEYARNPSLTRPREQTPAGRGFFSMLFGGGNQERRETRTLADIREELSPGELGNENYSGLRGSTFRTMCVRLSDGFYWPISFSTSRDYFSRDAAICSNMCPGTPVSLYVYQNPGENVEDMRSAATHAPYVNLDTAFQYRHSYNQTNACSRPYSPILAGPKRLDANRLERLRPDHPLKVAGLPLKRLPAALDPDSKINRWGGLDLQGFQTGQAVARAGEDIRIVGPTFSYLGGDGTFAPSQASAPPRRERQAE